MNRCVCWRVFVFLVSSLLLIGCRSQAELTTINQQAPIVVEGTFSGCSLSPTGHFAYLREHLTDVSMIYDLHTGLPITQTLQPPPEQHIDWIWLPNDVLFYATTSQQTILTQTTWVAGDGRLIDIPRETITQIADLPSARQTAVLEAITQAMIDRANRHSIIIAPNGRYLADALTIWEFQSPLTPTPSNPPPESIVDPRKGRQVNTINNLMATQCSHPWKADSSGIYILDTTGSRMKIYGGPIRFLPVEPIK